MRQLDDGGDTAHRGGLVRTADGEPPRGLGAGEPASTARSACTGATTSVRPRAAASGAHAAPISSMNSDMRIRVLFFTAFDARTSSIVRATRSRNPVRLRWSTAGVFDV